MIMFCGCDKYKFNVRFNEMSESQYDAMTNDRVILFFFLSKIMRNNYLKKKMYEAHDSACMYISVP